jgi:hypothetical protein
MGTTTKIWLFLFRVVGKKQRNWGDNVFNENKKNEPKL